MDAYLVGGAVRDELLGHQVREKDWVVVGSTPEEMVTRGFKPVGKDFPVFLHPDTHEEYALARTERKTGRGYQGFTFYTGKDVSLIEDLKRRDLTINAMAKCPKTGKIIDPCGGQVDLQAKILRHVSPAFKEDPVRFLRVCRFLARFPDFYVAPETEDMMRHMLDAGELDALVPERVWQELEKTFHYPQPVRFFDETIKINAFSTIFGDFESEISLSGLKQATIISQDPVVRFASTFCQLTPDHLKQFNRKLSPPKAFFSVAQLAQQQRQAVQVISLSHHSSPDQLLTLFEKTDAFRRPTRFEQLFLVCASIQPNASQKDSLSRKLGLLKKAQQLCSKIKLDEADKQQPGEIIAKKIHQKRLEALKAFLKNKAIR